MSFLSDIFSPIGKAITAPIRWGGDIIEKAGDITGIDPIKYLGRGVSDFTRQPMVQNIAGIAPLAAAGYFAAPYISSLFAGGGAAGSLDAAMAAEAAASAAELGAGGASATTGITATAPLFEAAATEGGLSPAAIEAIRGVGTQGGQAANAWLTGGVPLAAGAGAGALVASGGGATPPATPVFSPAELALERSGASFTGGVEGMGLPTTKSFIMPGMEKAGGYLDKTGGWIKENPIKSILAANALSSVLQSGMMGDVNKAQQESYANYLNAINPPEAVKRARYGALAENARTMGTLTQKRIDESLAARGVRGKGRAAPTGDVAEATRKSLNDAYNMIFGQYNVPGGPGPVNYAPSAGQLAGQSTAQMAAQGIPLMLLMSKYGVTG